ncbi:uncharacterized protein LOC125767047 isoform X1 [Anopheles funestus]|uniref:uncharacterized protein LOC125767047 isoform X1 n=1 Tax=Anopheles funestus TaxID=62324 RepID=UPI0020C6B549|nr:uncharacterized protein LOC125767047 isoform X1 [Anopheles funestus]
MCIFPQGRYFLYWTNGPLHANFIYDGYIIPYVTGYPSITWGNYEIKVFVKLSKFSEWIKQAIQELGEQIPTSLFDPLACAKKHLELRRKINGTKPLEKNGSIEFMVKLQDNPETNSSSVCAGVLIKNDFVATLAQCTTNLIPFSSRIVLSDSSIITIRDIFIHPEYSEGSFYNNIALLKLVSETSIRPAYFLRQPYLDQKTASVYGKERNGGTGFEDSSDTPVIAHGLSILLNYKCYPTEEQRLQLAQGLQFEHVCLQNDQFLVPGSCEAIPGSPVVLSDDIGSSPGLYMSGRNCGFGEPAIVVLFMAHQTWINSIIEAPPREPVVYTIPNLKLSDKCLYQDGTEGKCVTQSACNTYERLKHNLPLFFCEIKSVVCCPHSNIEVGEYNNIGPFVRVYILI